MRAEIETETETETETTIDRVLRSLAGDRAALAVSDIAETLGVSATTVRSSLAALKDDGLAVVVGAKIPIAGRGAVMTWALASRADEALIEVETMREALMGTPTVRRQQSIAVRAVASVTMRHGWQRASEVARRLGESRWAVARALARAAADGRVAVTRVDPRAIQYAGRGTPEPAPMRPVGRGGPVRASETAGATPTPPAAARAPAGRSGARGCV